MNSSGPTVMDWVEAEGCECTQFDSLCLRPSAYSKPRLCVNTAHGTNFTGHLLDAPCSNNNNNNLRNIGDPEDLLLLMMCAIIMIQVQNWEVTSKLRKKPIEMLIGLCLCGLTCKRICRAGHYSLQLGNQLVEIKPQVKCYYIHF